MGWRSEELWLDTDVLWFREPPALAAVEKWQAAPGLPGDDPCAQFAARSPRKIACLVGESGELIYPPAPMAALPSPLDLAELSDDQRIAGTSLQRLLIEAADPVEDAFQRFAHTEPPSR